MMLTAVHSIRRGWMAILALTLISGPAVAQDRNPLEELPGYDRMQQVRRSMRSLATGGTIRDAWWTADGSRLIYQVDGDWREFNLATGESKPFADDGTYARPSREAGGNRPMRRRPARGRQRTTEPSPDGQWKAVCNDWNVYLEHAETSERSAVTTDGNQKLRYGTASWVYGEELDQQDAMWWSPDSSVLAFYRFDEQHVRDFYLLDGWTDQYTTPLTEGYPKAGDPNPIADLMIHHLDSGETMRVGAVDDPEWYCYRVQFSPDGSELLYHRTNRLQNILELVAVDVNTGAKRVVVREEQDTWQDNAPLFRFLSDGQRFFWVTERNGWKNLQLRHLNGSLLAQMTNNDYPLSGIVQVDEDEEVVYFSAYSGDNPLNVHLHRVNFDGSGHVRLTTHASNHSRFRLSDDRQYFVAQRETVSMAPETVVHRLDQAKEVGVLCSSDTSGAKRLGMPAPELFSFKAEDGTTDVYGVLYKPTDFDPSKKYPLVIYTYGGPHSQSVRNSYRGANAYCELGFLIGVIDNRGTVNRGKAFESANYKLLGTVDVQDQADGVRHLAKRPYVDGSRVGIYGSSYGGYMSALALLKFPDVFHAAVANAAVTDWRNYDTIYTERYMQTPQLNPEGYDAGSCLTYVGNLKGHLLIQHGMMDDNVHPNNAFQLIHELQRAGKYFDLQMYPRSGHGIGGQSSNIMWAHFHEHLIGN